ncbi:MAG: serine hydrolase domain-containing protein [Parvibaculales bacterium]
MTDTPRLTPDTASFTGWRAPQNIRWSLRNFAILPSVMVPRGDTVYELASGTARDIEHFTYQWQGADVTLGTAMQADAMDGYIVIKDGAIIYEKYFDNFRQSDHHLWASMTKSLISTAYGIAAEKFGIDETQSPAHYLPALADSVFATVRIRDVLNMVTALDYTEEYEEMTPGSVHFEYFRRLGFLADFDLLAINPLQSDTPRGVRDMLPRFRQAPDGETGAVFQYQSPNVDVIGWLVETVTGQPIKDFVQSHIWGPLGTEHDAVFTTDVAFAPIATGGFNTTLRDAARFGLMALGDGQIGDTRIAPQGWMQDTYTLSDDDARAGAASVNADPAHERYYDGFSGYRSFWWNFDRNMGERLAMGVHGQVIYVNRAKNLVIANFASPEVTANMLRPSFKQMLAGTRALAASL